MIAIIATAIACFIVGGVFSYILFRYALKSRYENILKEAEVTLRLILITALCVVSAHANV